MGRHVGCSQECAFRNQRAGRQLTRWLGLAYQHHENIERCRRTANPSGTAKALGHSWGLWSLLREVSTAALRGHVGLAAASIGGGVAATAANAILSRALTNPRVVRWMAQSTKLPTAALPNAINKPARLGQAKNDSDATNLAAYLQQQYAAAQQ